MNNSTAHVECSKDNKGSGRHGVQLNTVGNVQKFIGRERQQDWNSMCTYELGNIQARKRLAVNPETLFGVYQGAHNEQIINMVSQEWPQSI